MNNQRRSFLSIPVRDPKIREQFLRFCEQKGQTQAEAFEELVRLHCVLDVNHQEHTQDTMDRPIGSKLDFINHLYQWFQDEGGGAEKGG